MKYRTKSVRLRQKLFASCAVIVTLFSTTLVSVNAMNRADEIVAAEKAAVATEDDVDQVVTDADTPGLWVTGDSVILGIRNVLAKYERIELITCPSWKANK